MDVKAFAIDIDGTITDSNHSLYLESIFSLRWLIKFGYKVILVSGRSIWEVYNTALLSGVTEMAVGENGGVIGKSPTDIITLADRSVPLLAYDYLSKHISNLQPKPVIPRFTEVVLLRTFDLILGQKLLSESGLPVTLNDSKFAYHLTNNAVNKARGLEVALSFFDIKLKNVVAIGDGENDIPMFKECGYSIAIGDNNSNLSSFVSHSVKGPSSSGMVNGIQHVLEKFSEFKLGDN